MPTWSHVPAGTNTQMRLRLGPPHQGISVWKERSGCPPSPSVSPVAAPSGVSWMAGGRAEQDSILFACSWEWAALLVPEVGCRVQNWVKPKPPIHAAGNPWQNEADPWHRHSPGWRGREKPREALFLHSAGIPCWPSLVLKPLLGGCSAGAFTPP